MKTETDQSLQQESLSDKAHRLIPGGCHTYAKGDDQFPSNAPRFLVRGKGCRVWDPDGREFIEYGMGLRAVTLGHAHPDVIAAAYAQMQLGNNFGRPHRSRSNVRKRSSSSCRAHRWSSSRKTARQ